MELLAGTALLVALALCGLAWRLARALGDKQDRLVALEHALVDHLAEEQGFRLKQASLLEQQKLVEQSVETGAKSAEVVHKTIAGVTFDVLDSVPATKDVSKLVRGLHDGIADSIYDTVRTSNREIGSLAKHFLKMKENYDKAQRKSRLAKEPEDQGEQQASTKARDKNPDKGDDSNADPGNT